MGRQDLRHDVARQIYVGKAEQQQHALARTLHQLRLGCEREGAGSLGAHQRARDVEAVLRQQLMADALAQIE